MDISMKILFLESRLHRLSTRKTQDNTNIRRKIIRQINKLKKGQQACRLIGRDFLLCIFG